VRREQGPGVNVFRIGAALLVAAIMAIGRALVAQEEPQSEYSLFFV
jgi:hypothetical protein